MIGRLRKVFFLNMVSVWVAVVIIFVLMLIAEIHIWGFYNGQYVTEKYQMEIRKDVQTLNKRLLYVLISDDASVTEEQSGELEARFQKMSDYIVVICENMEKPELEDRLNESFHRFQSAAWEMLTLADGGDIQEVKEYYNTSFHLISEELAEVLGELGDLASERADLQFKVVMGSMGVTVILLFFLAALCSIQSNRRTEKLLKNIEQDFRVMDTISREMEAGNIHRLLDLDQDNTIARVSPAFRQALDKLVFYIEDIKRVMTGMAGGDFHYTFSGNFQGDFDEIRQSIEKFQEQISAGMHEIAMVSEKVSAGAGHIAEAGVSLAESCGEQSLIVSVFSETIEKITALLEQNASNTAEICDEISDMGTGMLQSNQRMQDMVKAMNDINRTAQEINKIIDSIDSIAAQTNLLSLNASIESARAGEAGRGFAVVANEVSALAGQSAEAAQNSSSLIEASIRAVKEGKEIADRTAEELSLMAERVQPIFRQMEQLIASSAEQKEFIRALVQGIDEISRICEVNAAAAEEGSALSNEFDQQAQVLKNMVVQFEE